MGTTSPSSNIDIEDAAEVKIDLNSTAGRTYRLRSTTDSKFIVRDSSASADRLTINSSGNVGIGTSSPANKLSVSDATNAFIAITNATAVKTSYIGTTAAGDFEVNASAALANAIFKTVGSERMRIDSSGRVGIGTSSPARDLEIGV